MRHRSRPVRRCSCSGMREVAQFIHGGAGRAVLT
jgi:hypothetical protein